MNRIPTIEPPTGARGRETPAARRLQAGLLGLFMLLGLAALSVPLIMRGVDEAVARTLRHEIAWTAQHGRNELNEAFRRIAALDAEAMPAGLENAKLDTARLAGDIFFSRMATWSSGRLAAFIAETNVRSARFRTVIDRLPALDAALEDIARPEARRAALALLAEIEPTITGIAAETYIRYHRNLAESGEQLRFYHRVQVTFVASLILCSLLLIFVLTLQNRSLARSHARQTEVARQNAFLAAHDALTGLPNRKTFMTALTAACARAMPGRAVAVIAIDLDGFKPINDVLGHKVGDLLLVALGDRLRDIADKAEGGLAARFGGDEFLMMVEGIAEAEAAEAFAERVREELRLPTIIDNHRVSIGATIGLSVLSRCGVSPEEFVQQADIALNLGKAASKGVVRTFHEAMLDGAALRRQLESDLADADLEAQFEPHYQPVIDLATRRIIGVEALARWRHPARGLVQPSDFIPVAESSGRIVDIGAIILRKACEDAARWPAPIGVAVNLSAVQLLRVDVPGLVERVLADAGLPASRLKLEITESVMIHDARGTHRLMVELQEMGVTVSLDDFGTGFSSLSYLRTFPFDEIKIDRSFLAGIESDGQAAAIVQTILALARSLDMSVVAEGIETERQALLLTAMGCAKGQGWRFGRPMPLGELMDLLVRDSAQAMAQTA